MTDKRERCTPERPYSRTLDEELGCVRWDHPQAREVGEQLDGYPGGDIITMRCHVCHITWKEELPQ